MRHTGSLTPNVCVELDATILLVKRWPIRNVHYASLFYDTYRSPKVSRPNGLEFRPTRSLGQSFISGKSSAYYYGRSVVPAESRERAIEILVAALKEQDILVETVLATVVYEDGLWDDDEFDVQASFEEAKNTNEIEIGCLLSEKSMKGS